MEASRTPNPKGQEGDREGQEEGKRARGWQEDKGRVKDWRELDRSIGVVTITIPLGMVGGSLSSIYVRRKTSMEIGSR